MKNLGNVIGSRAARFVLLRVALVLCVVMVFAGLGATPAWQNGIEWLSLRNASARSKAASAPHVAGRAQEPGITLGNSYHNDTSPRLRDMLQVPAKSNALDFGQSTKAQETVTVSGTDSDAIVAAGISPDTDGEVGATQRVKIVNRSYQIFDNRTGASLLGPSDVSTIWAGFGSPCETGGAGDAVILYDKVADRWIISQFASATGGKAATEECFAVSTTSDATGSYYRYAFHLGGNFIDFPHLTAQPDGYLMGDSIYNESGTERLGTQFFLFDKTAMLAGSAAAFTSPGIDAGGGETYSISADGVSLASEPSGLAVSTLTINLTYASDATFTAAGLSAADIANMKAANTYAASQFTNNFRDPINVNIFVTAVPGTSTLGGSSSSISSQPFTTGIRDPTRADATSTDDATMAGAGGSVPSGLADPIGGTHNWLVTKAQGKALRIAADDLTTDGTYTFGGGFSYTYDPNNRAVAGKIDYIGVSMHEFSEIMGRIYGLGRSLGGTPSYLQMDLFHYTAANTRGLTNGAGRSFSFNNGTSLLKAFNNGSANGGDGQDWASGTNDSFNAFSSSSVKNDLTAVDLKVMDVIGYDNASNLPAPTLTVRSVSATNVQVNQPVTVSTTLLVSNATADHAGISISFPSLTSSGITGTPPSEAYNSAQGTVATASSSSITGGSSLQYYGAGEILACGTSTCAAQHLLVEGDWVTVGSGNTRSLNLTVTPKVPGTFVVRMRGWVTSPGYQNPSRDPSSGPLDQQSFPAYEVTITVSGTPPSSPTANAATNVTSSSFTANWSSSSGATGYRLDVSTSNSFGSFVSGYQNLDVGNVLSRSVTGLSPSTTYFYRVRAYNGGGTSGNSNTINVTTMPGVVLPDLVVTSLTAPISGSTGAQITVAATIVNQGSASAGAFRLEFYFSTDSVITTSDTDTGWGCTLAGLAAGGSTTCSGPIGVPSSIPPGIYFFGAIADDLGAVSESNESNNARAADTGPIILSGGQGTCASPYPLIIGKHFNGNTSGGQSTFGSYNCVAWSESGPERVHGITLTAPGTLTASLSNLGNNDLDVFILTSCSSGSCLAFGDNEATANVGPGTYYILVDGFQGAVGGYTLTVRETQFDFDGDARTDQSVWRPSTGVWLIKKSSNGSTASVGWGINGDKIAPGDYDGDGKTDTAIWRPSTGAWFIINSSDGSTKTVGWGVNGDLPAPADYDGDGKTDIAVWRPSSGVWFIINSSNGSVTSVGWGVNGDVPVAGDYDGDGKSDIAVWRPSTGVWFIIKSSNGSTLIQGWGVPGDKAVPGDYDGDGKTDIAIWRPSTGVWFIINSVDGSTRVQGWGVSGDVPVPGDYDGDGRTDIAVWRPSSGTWFIINSSNGLISQVAWGMNGDTPVPSAFVP